MVAPAHLKSLQALEMAIRLGSLTRAGQQLGITPAAVGQRIKSLEDYLGVALLQRGRAGIRAAPEVSSALPHLVCAFSALESAATELDLQRGYEIHIAAISSFADLWLRPRLEHFRERHPNILFCINGEGTAPPRFGKVDCEIGFRSIQQDERHLPLFRDFVVPISSPANFERTASLEPHTRLQGFPLLHLDFYRNDPVGISWPDWFKRNGIERTAPERGIRFQQIGPLLDAIEADAGISLCGLVLLAERVQNGTIRLPYPIETGSWTKFGFVAEFRSDASRRPVAMFREWLTKEAQAADAWLQEVVREGGTV